MLFRSERGGAVLLPDPTDAVPCDHGIASKAIRTVAPHETGGNVDIKQLTAGTKLRIPVYVPGALFSVGDAHFAQGDNESCGTAVEMGATFYGSFKLLKGEAKRRGIKDLQFYRDDYFTAPEMRSEEHTSELQSRSDLVCRLLLEKKTHRHVAI